MNKTIWPALLALVLPLFSHAFEPVAKYNNLLFFTHGDKGVVYNLQALSTVGEFELPSPPDEFIVDDTGTLYALDFFGIYKYPPPNYIKSAAIEVNDGIAGFGIIDNKLFIGHTNGKISAYDKSTLELLFEGALEGYVGDFATAGNNLFAVNQQMIKQFTLTPMGELIEGAQIPAPDDWISASADGKMIRTLKGFIFNSTDLSFVAKPGGVGDPTWIDGEKIISRHVCGYTEFSLGKAEPKTYLGPEELTFPDYTYREGDEIVELNFQQAVTDSDYTPLRTKVNIDVPIRPFFLDQPLPAEAFFAQSFESSGDGLLFFTGTDPENNSIVNIWSIADEQFIKTVNIPCGLRSLVFSKATQKFYIYDNIGRIYAINNDESKLEYINTFKNEAVEFVATDEYLIVNHRSGAYGFDYSGVFSGPLPASAITPPPTPCFPTIPSHTTYPCEKNSEIKNIPGDQIALVEWIDNRQISLTTNYKLIIWDESDEPVAQFDVPFNYMYAEDGRLMLMRASPDGTEILALDPFNLLDADSDGLVDLADNCPNVLNPAQDDLDQDKIGDLCDQDIDGDLIPNQAEELLGLDRFNPADANGDSDGDQFSNLIEYTLGSNSRSKASIPAFDRNYFESFENGLPLRILSGNNRPWTTSKQSRSGDFGLKSADMLKSNNSSTMTFFSHSDQYIAVNFALFSTTAFNVKVNGQPAFNYFISSLQDGWQLVGFTIGSGINKIEITASPYEVEPSHFNIRYSSYLFIDDLSITSDRDFDGTGELLDQCPLISFEFGSMVDRDQDGIGHLCDPDDNHFDQKIDADADGYFTHNDNCPDVFNDTQLDTNFNLIGDVCDPDDDGDGIGDELEVLHGSSPIIYDQQISLARYFPVKPGLYSYQNSEGQMTSSTLEMLAKSEFRSVDEEGFFTTYRVISTGMFIDSIGDKTEQIPLDGFFYLPTQWDLTDGFLHTDDFPIISLRHEARLLKFHIVEFQNQLHAAVTFRIDQWVGNQLTSTEETYLKDLGLYSTDDFVLVSFKPLSQPNTPDGGNEEVKKKKKGGSLEWLTLILLVMIGSFRTTVMPNTKLINSYERA